MSLGRRGTTLVELLTAMALLGVGLAGAIGALVKMQSSITQATRQSQAVHIAEELAMQARALYVANNAQGVGSFHIPDPLPPSFLPIVANMFQAIGTNRINPRMDVAGATCTSTVPTTQNCLFKFYNPQVALVQNILDNAAPGPCPSALGPITTRCFDPDPTDSDATRYSIEWTMANFSNQLDNTGGMGVYETCRSGGGGGGPSVLMKRMQISVCWGSCSSSEKYTADPIFMGC